MIAQLTGTITDRTEDAVVLDVDGVGYHVFVTPTTGAELQDTSETVTLFTHLYLRDDAQELYGFTNRNERQLFEALIAVSGVGPKTALTVLTVAAVDTLQSAIAQGDYSLLTKVSGIGNKTARKIVLELSEKMPDLDAGAAVSAESDAIDALTSLGYSQSEARQALRAVSSDVEGVEARVKAALKTLG